jgi:hypothetical protein
MSFLQRARDAANQMADQAKTAAESVATQATDKDTQDKLKKQMSVSAQFAKRSMKSVVERIDPSTLADLIIKATALQEIANKALREKGSPYRISEITISATIPPGVNFAIGRIDDPEAVAEQVKASTELVAASSGDGDILSLTGASDVAELAEEVADGAISVDPEPAPADSGMPDPTSRPW